MKAQSHNSLSEQFILKEKKSSEKNFKLLERLKDRDDIHVRFADTPKIGVNPGYKYSNPIGVYTYPLKQMWKQFQDNNIPFASKMKYIHVLQENPQANIVDVADPNFDVEEYVGRILEVKNGYYWKKLFNDGNKEILSDTAINIARDGNLDLQNDKEEIQILTILNYSKLNTAYPNLPMGILWWFMFRTVRNAKEWTKLFLEIGIDAITDKTGTGLIHENEPVQAVFMHPRSYKRIDFIKNFFNDPEFVDNLDRPFFINDKVKEASDKAKEKAMEAVEKDDFVAFQHFFRHMANLLKFTSGRFLRLEYKNILEYFFDFFENDEEASAFLDDPQIKRAFKTQDAELVLDILESKFAKIIQKKGWSQTIFVLFEILQKTPFVQDFQKILLQNLKKYDEEQREKIIQHFTSPPEKKGRLGKYSKKRIDFQSLMFLIQKFPEKLPDLIEGDIPYDITLTEDIQDLSEEKRQLVPGYLLKKARKIAFGSESPSVKELFYISLIFKEFLKSPWEKKYPEKEKELIEKAFRSMKNKLEKKGEAEEIKDYLIHIR